MLQNFSHLLSQNYIIFFSRHSIYISEFSLYDTRTANQISFVVRVFKVVLELVRDTVKKRNKIVCVVK